MAEENMAEIIKRLNELEKKAQVAEDIEQIKQLHNRYINAHTTDDADGQMECFADDATFACGTSHPPMVGKAAIEKFTRMEPPPEAAAQAGPMPKDQIPAAGHFIVHPIIKVNGDKATGSWLQYCLHSDQATMHVLFWVQGFYDVEYVKRNGEWKISYMKWEPRSEPRGFGEH